ncbi:MAG TPA: TetR/AcrR family transcriptional regulator, partial [Thermomicrobiales bacterium]|nr:TetR/AcrR family transcriptional regulator [Thermomicrobiales bacterium]
MSSDSRQKMIASAASLIASRGVNATSFSDVLADSGAPRGSIYHHFPEGKRQLAEDAIRWTSSRVLAFMRAGTPT